MTEACDTTAKILRLVGGKEAEALAWDYLTTPLALKPNESDPWQVFRSGAWVIPFHIHFRPVAFFGGSPVQAMERRSWMAI